MRRAVSRLPVDPGPAGWARLLPMAEPATPLSGDVSADWLVIGAGFAGLAAARRITQLCPTDQVVILDATRVGEGPAGRNSGFMIDLPHDLSSEDYGGALDKDRAATKDNRRAIGFAKEMAEVFGLGPECLAPSGKINGAATERGMAHNRSYAAHLEAMGEPFEMLSADQMAARTGSAYYLGGLYTPGTVMLQPAGFVRGVAAGLRSNRVSIYETSPVTGLTTGDGWVATTPNGSVRTAKVILAVNGHLESFGFCSGRLVHVHTYASMTRALDPQEVEQLGAVPDWGITSADPLGTSVRRISGPDGHRIVVRNRVTFDPDLEPRGALDRIAADHRQSFDARFPMLTGVPMEHIWGGRLCLSRNGVQVIGELEPGLFAACVQNGLGTVRGTLAGMLAVDLALGVASPALDRALAAAPPRRLPPRSLAKIGASARLLWGERRAGREF